MAEELDAGVDWRAAVRDRWLWLAFGLGLFLRVAPMVLWPQFECIRDECIYRSMGDAILAGDGLTVSNKGWLPSPGYPYALALSKYLFGTYFSIKIPQILLAMVTLLFSYVLGHRVAGERVARVTALLFALHPTLAWFTNTQWIETIYIFFLFGSMAFLLDARAGRLRMAALAGLFLGGAMLFKGVATYLPPFFLAAALAPREGGWSWAAWKASILRRNNEAAIFLVTVVLAVAPYSMYASRIQGGFLVVDATVGHVLYLGNNDFPPLTFDYGNGMLTQPLFGKYLRAGRRPCPREGVPPVVSSRCEVEATKEWIADNPERFVERIPVRLAQLFNPNSFLTRHIRWGYWTGLPWWAKEALCAVIVAFSVALTWAGTVGAWARARGPYAWMAVTSVVYTVATTVMSYGMTRFRLPMEALWLVYLAIVLVDPRGTFAALRASPLRLAGALFTLPPLVALTLWYLPTGFPMFW